MNEQLTKKQRREQQREQKLARREAEQEKANRANAMKWGIAAGVIIIVLGGFFLSTAQAPEVSTVTAADRGAEDPVLGPEEADVTIQYFGDYQCPACSSASLGLVDVVNARDDVRLVHNDLPLNRIHPLANQVALLGECTYRIAGNDAFWELDSYIYETQSEWSSGTDLSTLMAYAAELGVDEEVLNTCIASEEAQAAINGDVEESSELDIDSTPTFFVNDKRIVGGRSADAWNNIIDEALSDD